MTRAAAFCAYALLIVAGHLVMLPLAAWRALQSVDSDSPAFRAALLWDLALAALLGAQPGETVSTYMARLRPARVACAFCRLLAVRWPTHCDDAASMKFTVRKE